MCRVLQWGKRSGQWWWEWTHFLFSGRWTGSRWLWQCEKQHVKGNLSTFNQILHTVCKITRCLSDRETFFSLSVSRHPAPQIRPLHRPLGAEVEEPRRVGLYVETEEDERPQMAANACPWQTFLGQMELLQEFLSLCSVSREIKKRRPSQVNTWNYTWLPKLLLIHLLPAVGVPLHMWGRELH